MDPKGLINKATLIFAAKFFEILVQHMLYPIQEVNMVAWDRAVLVVALVAALGLILCGCLFR